MPQGERSEPTILYELLLEAMEESYNFLSEQWSIPFLQERISPTEYRRRWLAMTDEQKQAEFARLGIEEVRQRVLTGA